MLEVAGEICQLARDANEPDREADALRRVVGEHEIRITEELRQPDKGDSGNSSRPWSKRSPNSPASG